MWRNLCYIQTCFGSKSTTCTPLYKKTIPNGSLNISYLFGIKMNGWNLISFCQINKELKKKIMCQINKELKNKIYVKNCEAIKAYVA